MSALLHAPTRRDMLLGSGALFAWAFVPRLARADSRWLNRALAGLAPGDRVGTGTNGRRSFAVGPITPLVVRGPAPVLSWVPPRLPPVSDETTMRLLAIYRETDPTLARVL